MTDATTTAFDPTEQAAIARDESSPSYRDRFEIPLDSNGRPLAYFCGNSLGCMPRAARDAVKRELDLWGAKAVDAHFSEDPSDPLDWFSFHESCREPLAGLLGAKPDEVCAMNALTVNLHLLMATFYRPEGRRRKILIESPGFPSDSYAVASQARWHGLDPADAVVRVPMREGATHHEEDDIVAAIEREGDELATVMLSGVHYTSGQFFDIARVTEAAHRAGATAGFDLAHAAGNVPLRMHDWGADYASWCSYKYLNSGPGAPSGVFVHERHFGEPLPRLEGWWSNDPETRFLMRPDIAPAHGADAWAISNPPVIAMAALRASLEIFHEIGIDALRARSLELTGYLEALIRDRCGDAVRFLTPADPSRRGAQLSIVCERLGDDPVATLRAHGVVADFRHPNVVRVAPAPLYATFHDCWRLADALAEITR